MKKINYFFILFFFFTVITAFSQDYKYNDSWGPNGFKLKNQSNNGVTINFSVNSFSLTDVQVKNELMKSVLLPGVFLPNDAGKPDLAGTGRYIAIPHNSQVNYRIVNQRIETIKNVSIAPAPVLPLDSDPSPLKYEKDNTVYSKDELYPQNPVLISAPTQIRGVDVVLIGITPFQYNPIKKELIIYRDLEIQIDFKGNTEFAGENFRSRWWEPILSDAILNYNSLPVIDFNQKNKNISTQTGFEYVIIVPNAPEFSQWADSLKNFRNEQGIKTGVFKLSEIGGNTVDLIKTWVNNAYNTWNIKPAAICLMADYGTDANNSIISKIQTHPAGYPAYASDNYFSDVNGDEMPEIVFSRLVANNANDLRILVTKQINHERTPPTGESFYSRMITALGWQTERWFQLCSEVVGGFFKKKLYKEQLRINAIYSGTPGTSWSSATNTSTVVNYFGPNYLGYIPGRPDSLGAWSGGTATMINSSINQGAFLLLHRDHGLYTGWGEPIYRTNNIPALNNSELTFVYSINCQTGAFHNPSGCPANGSFAEVFMKYTYNGNNSGTVGMVCPTEVSYSFVNDAYVWGNMDNMFPNFLPDYGSNPASRDMKPAFGMAAGKFFLQQSSWPYNTSDKLVTYRLFHMHGDAFLNLYSEFPQMLTVNHSNTITSNSNQFSVTANQGALIAISVNGKLLATASGNDSPVTLSFSDELITGQKLKVVVTKQNYRRYTSEVEIIQGSGTTCKNVSVNSGWNIVSVPVLAGNMSNSGIFPTATSQAYHYNNGYFPIDTLINATGYWLKFPSTEIVQVCGNLLTADSIQLLSGWNLIGMMSNDIPVISISTTPVGIINSPFYGFENNYIQPTILNTGKGYWVKSTQNGLLYLHSSVKNTLSKLPELKKSDFLNTAIKIEITDNTGNIQNVYLTSENKDLSYFELPPVPPTGVFDCRFSNERFVENINENISTLNINSANYPVKLKVLNGSINIKDAFSGDLINSQLKENEEVIIPNPTINKLKITANISDNFNFYLGQNYPNPFNPNTSISYQLPAVCKVTLTIFDVLGKSIETLINKEQTAGKYSIEFDGTKYSSGIYYYELKAGQFRTIKKMIIIK